MKFKNIIIILLLLLISCGGDILEEDDRDQNAGSKIYVVGGLSGTGIGTTVSGIDVYNIDTNSWDTNVTTLPTPVSFAGAVTYTRPADGHHLLIVVGGFDSSGVVRNLVQIYDIESDSWSYGASMTVPLANINAIRVYDKIFVMGGTTGNSSAAWAATNLTYEYDIGGSWAARTSYGTAASERFMYSFNDVIYNIGGRSGAAAVAASAHDGYIVALASTAPLTAGGEVAISTARTGIAGAMWVPEDGPARIFLIGGFGAPAGCTTNCIIDNIGILAAGSTPQSLAQYLKYPFTGTSTWFTSPTVSTMIQYPLNIGFGSAVISGNVLYHFGGTISIVTTPTKLASGTTAAYSTKLTELPVNIWTQLPTMPVGRYGHTAVLVNR